MKTISDNIKPTIALMVVVLSFTYFFLCTFGEVNPDPQIIIAIVAALGNTQSYYFGSSTGAARKDETISDLAKKQ